MKKKVGKRRLDRYYHLAKEHGYRARSAFKLLQLAQRHHFFSNCQVLLDLCAAPGGWLQVAQQNLPVASTIVGVDLVPIKAIPNVTAIQADITTPQCVSLIKKVIPKSSCHVVLHDGAPNVGTSWIHDAFKQNELVLSAVKLSCEFLAPGGIFVTKVFRSQDYTSLLYLCQQLFRRVVATKPTSSRDVSAEIFMICHHYNSPSRIDPKFFDPAYIFVSSHSIPSSLPSLDASSQPKRSIKDLLKAAQKPHRQGYDDEQQFRPVPVSKFFEEDIRPAEFLVANLGLDVSADDDLTRQILAHSRTTPTILKYCADLKVLGQRELKQLIAWRFHVKKSLADEAVKNSLLPVVAMEDDVPECGPNEDQIEEKIQTLENQILKQKSKEQKKIRKLLLKRRFQKEKSLGAFDFTTVDDDELFHNTELVREAFEEEDEVLGPELLSKDPDALIYDDDDDDDDESKADPTARLICADDEERLLQMDTDMQVLADLESERQRKKQELAEKLSNRTKKEKKRLRNQESQPSKAEDISHVPVPKVSEPPSSDDDYDQAEGLKLTCRDFRFFQHPLFQYQVDDPEPIAVVSLPDADKVASVEELEPEPLPLSDKQARKLKSRKKQSVGEDVKKESCDFQEVPRELCPKSDDDKAQVHALGSLLAKKKTRLDLMDASYNRYAYDRDESLPAWFYEDEMKFNRPILPVPAQYEGAYVKHFNEAMARMGKKAWEAKQRKKCRLHRQLQKLRQKVAANPDETSRQQTATLKRMVRKAFNEDKDKAYVATRKKGGSVAIRSKNRKKSGGGQTKTRTVLVDRRLKKDKRAQRRADQSKSRRGRSMKRQRH